MTRKEVSAAFSYIASNRAIQYIIISGEVPGILRRLLPDDTEYTVMKEAIGIVSADFKKYSPQLDGKLRVDAMAALARRVHAKLYPKE